MCNKVEKYTLTERLHKVNVRFPWLKVLLLVLVIAGIVLGVVGILNKATRQVIGETVVVRENKADNPLSEEEGRIELDDGTGSQEEAGGQAQASSVESEPEPDSELTSGSAPEVEEPSSPPEYVPLQSGADKKLVALTFDDGPSATTTARLLDILAQKQVKATFFVLGVMAQKSPAMIKREAAEGHEIESHTMSHLNLIEYSAADIQAEVSGVDNILQDLVGVPAKFVRPPYGSINDTVRQNVRKPMIIWTVDPADWKYRDTATVRANVVSHVFDGAIILLHDIYGTTVEAVPGIIDDLRAAGYEFLTVAELAAARGVVPMNGYSYGSFRL